MTEAQTGSLKALCERSHVEFDPTNFTPQWDLPTGYVAGWIGTSIYVGCDPDGAISS